MENFVLNTLVDFCKENEFKILKGEYISTAKNEMVKDHYLNLGFNEIDAFWVLNISGYQEKLNHISIK